MRKVSEPWLDRILIKVNGYFAFVQTPEIRWIEAQGNYARLHIRDKDYLVRRPIREFESRLGANFVRIHRSFIVNLEHVLELQPLPHGDLTVVIDDGTQLTRSRRYRGKLKNL